MPPPPAFSTPIGSRAPPTRLLRLRSLWFNIFFFSCALVLHTAQILVLPLAVIPGQERTFRASQRFGKDAFGTILRAVNTWFGPSSFVLSSDGSVDLKKIAVRDEAGRVRGLDLERRSVWICNHSQYQDWLVLWLLMGISRVATGLCIIMKASLMWAPIVGPAMQMFSFEFISKTRLLQRPNGTVVRFAKQAVADESAFTLLLFPEGTLFSRLTRPKSSEFAKANGFAEPENLLLPRSTGLLYSLRTLRLIIPDLVLYDVTIGYPGMKVGAYAQDYYSLQTVYGFGASADIIRIHLQQVPLDEIPLGAEGPSPGINAEEYERRCTKEDRAKFDEWLRARWMAKDALMREFYNSGKFSSAEEELAVEIKFGVADAAVLGSIAIGLFVAYKLLRLVV